MSGKLKEVEIRGTGNALKMSRVEVPDYVTRAVAESFEKGVREAEAARSKDGLRAFVAKLKRNR